MPIELDAATRRKIFRQHRDLRQVLAAAMETTTGAQRDNARRLRLLVALGLRLQRMIERHSVFEEAALRPLQPLLGRGDAARIEALASNHRQQRVELSLLTQLAFGNGRLGRILLAFRRLSESIIKQMNIEERELFRGTSPGSSLRHRNGENGAKRAGAPAPTEERAAVAPDCAFGVTFGTR